MIILYYIRGERYKCYIILYLDSLLSLDFPLYNIISYLTVEHRVQPMTVGIKRGARLTYEGRSIEG